jgi:hypothetical protein
MTARTTLPDCAAYLGGGGPVIWQPGTLLYLLLRVGNLLQLIHHDVP